VVANERLITKIYFPRLVIPIAGVFAGLVDFAIAFVVLIALMLHYGIGPTWTIATLPLFVLLAILSALAVGLWLSALNVLMQLGLRVENGRVPVGHGRLRRART
jgi:homopolymeric O-antigen transport system permease protein